METERLVVAYDWRSGSMGGKEESLLMGTEFLSEVMETFQNY